MEWTIKNDCYETVIDGIKIKIKKDHLTKETHTYSYGVTKTYKENEDKVLKYVEYKLVKQGISLEGNTLREKMGLPEIEIFSQGSGVLVWFVFFVNEKKVVCEFEGNMGLRGVKVFDKAVLD